MTTTHTFQGLNTDNKPSSRVLNPPGGSSSNIFGGNDDRAPQKTPARNIQDKSEGQPPSQPTTTAPAGSNPQSKARGNRSAFNPITGEAYDEPKQKSMPEPHHPPPASVSAESIDSKTIVDTSASSEQLENTVPNEGAAPEQVVSPVESAPAITEPAQAKPPPQQQAQSGGMFGGGSNDAREHTSTRVSQPPGGRSTKLW